MSSAPWCTVCGLHRGPHLIQSDERRLFVDADGFVWWDNGDGTHSMARTNPDNSPTPKPWTYYAPVDD